MERIPASVSEAEDDIRRQCEGMGNGELDPDARLVSNLHRALNVFVYQTP